MEQRWFVTGDKHGKIEEVWRFIKRFGLNEGDNIIVCGDMGIFWNKDQKDADYSMKKYEEYCNCVNLYWIDGNHENFDIINTWEKEENGLIKNSKHIFYIPRGTIMNLNIGGNTRSCLFMGGADSIDRMWRTEGISWWPQERITEDNIKDIKGHFDYVFSHCCPYSIFNRNRAFLCMHGGEIRDITHESELMLNKMCDTIDFNMWFFGHYHINWKIEDKFQCLYSQFIELK